MNYSHAVNSLITKRNLGLFLAQMPKNPGARAGKAKRPPAEVGRLEDFGISYNLSAKTQKLAAVPEEKFEEAQ